MRQDVEKKPAWCLPCAARATAGKKWIVGLLPIQVGVRFRMVAADIFGLVTIANERRVKHIWVMKDFFTKYVVIEGYRSTRLWKAGFCDLVPDVFHTDQGKNFGSELMSEVCRLLKIDETRNSPCHPQDYVQVERHNRVIADVISKYCAESPRKSDRLLPHKVSFTTPPFTGQQKQHPTALSMDKIASTPYNCSIQKSMTKN